MTEQRIKSFPVSWEELHRTSKALAWRLLELGPFEGLIAVTRGGLVPAAIVARELEIRLIDTACISSYAGNERGKLDVLKPSPLAGDGSGWLIVDDLVDTGETAKALKLMMPKAHLATVYAKPAGRPLVDTFVTEVSQDTWIFFPWDLEPQPSSPIIGQRWAKDYSVKKRQAKGLFTGFAARQHHATSSRLCWTELEKRARQIECGIPSRHCLTG